MSPRRWLDPASGASDGWRRLLEAGRDERPSPEQLEALLARLDGGGPGGFEPGPAGGTALTKAAVGGSRRRR